MITKEQLKAEAKAYGEKHKKQLYERGRHLELAFLAGAERASQFPSQGLREEGIKSTNLKITFIDCWEKDREIPESDRWLASFDNLAGMVVTAPTKEKAFEEAMVSLKVKVMYDSNYRTSTPDGSQGKEMPLDDAKNLYKDLYRGKI